MTTETLPEVRPIETRERIASDVLRAAARIIEEHGWCQDALEDLSGRHCVLGAINRAATGDALFGQPGAYAFSRLWDFLATGVVDWNNAPERTQAEVIAALREAAR